MSSVSFYQDRDPQGPFSKVLFVIAVISLVVAVYQYFPRATEYWANMKTIFPAIPW